ncbi:MAG: CDP-diacylglycerol--glycerol-3-phosphate 3-phosphatidyltransferase [Peptococcaceae bacterium]|nr:CDP-diacylglycerol--glycerol-3-phosphate 3-phosphatidyltransferase [Peptococcaceae bacterium]
MNLANGITLVRIALIPVMVAVLAVAISVEAHIESEVLSYSMALRTLRIVAAGLFVLAAATDWLDGYVARTRGLVTDLGKFLDPLADKLLVSAALIMLVQLGEISGWMVWVILAREFAVTGLRAVAAAAGRVVAASWWGKVKTAVQMVVITLLLLGVGTPYFYGEFGAGFGPGNAFVVDALLFVVMLVTVVSGVEYFWKNRGVFVSASKK